MPTWYVYTSPCAFFNRKVHGVVIDNRRGLLRYLLYYYGFPKTLISRQVTGTDSHAFFMYNG